MEKTRRSRQVYNRKNRAWKLFLKWRTAYLAERFPDTGGNDLLIHNWYVVGNKDGRSAEAKEALRFVDARWTPIREMSRRLYRKAVHLEDHVANDDFHYCCEYCKAEGRIPDRDGDPRFEAEVATLRKQYEGRNEVRTIAVQDEGDSHYTYVRVTDPDKVARIDVRARLYQG